MLQQLHKEGSTLKVNTRNSLSFFILKSNMKIDIRKKNRKFIYNIFLTFHKNPTNGNKNERNIMDVFFVVVTMLNFKKYSHEN